ncbi:SDR family oxidoreductase [Sphingomonadaceae bacterium OTU29LAMAA1]|nr:SDR family oxidoreductase [Sphingomonadaceae bacterium OTU29LAMAA1]
MANTWLITGANSGFGKLMTEALLARGDSVAALVRTPETLQAIDAGDHSGRLIPLRLDLTDDATIVSAVDRAFAELGRIDVVVSNAGYGTFGAIEELSPAQIRRQLETNLIGTILFIRAVLLRLRRQGGGRIVQVSSEGGRIAYPGFSTYHASKWGQEGFVEAVAQEVRSFGIEMSLVEPGPTGTNFLSGVDMGDPLPDYAGSPVAGLRDALQGGGFDVTYGDPVLIAQAIIALAEAREMPLRAPLGSVAWENINREARARLELLSTQRDAAYACDEETA